MTEEEWFASADVRPMLDWIAGRVTERRLLLLACAFLRGVPSMPWEVYESLKYVEKYCDGLMRWGEVETRVHKKAFQANQISLGTGVYSFNFPPLLNRPAIQVARSVIDYCVSGLDYCGLSIPARSLIPAAYDIVGNPFRPVAFSPSWRTDTAVAIAKQMYDQREFSAMPILADALQDAGCDHEGILSHCRDAAQAHVRGCWVVDLVLGKA